MNILILNVHSALNLGDDAIMYTTIQSLHHRFPGANITVAANDPDSWAKYEDIEVYNALCAWITDCRLGLWRKQFYLTPLVLLFLFLSTILYRLFNYRLHLGSQKKNQLLDSILQLRSRFELWRRQLLCPRSSQSRVRLEPDHHWIRSGVKEACDHAPPIYWSY